MNEIVAKFISDCKNSGRTFVALSQVPYEVMEELARRREPALVDSLIDSAIEEVTSNLTDHSAVFDTETFRVAFFDI